MHRTPPPPCTEEAALTLQLMLKLQKVNSHGRGSLCTQDHTKARMTGHRRRHRGKRRALRKEG